MFLYRVKFISFVVVSGAFWANLTAIEDCLMVDGWLGITSASMIAFSVMSEFIFTIGLIIVLFSPFNFFSLAMYLEPKILLRNPRDIALTCLFTAMQPLLVVFLPWEDSLFCRKSGGFPNIGMFRLLYYSEAVLNTIRIIAILMSQSYRSSALSFLALIASILGLILTLLEIAVKLKGMEIYLLETIDVESRRARVNSNNVEMGNNMEDIFEVIKEEIEDLREQNRESFRNSSSSFDEGILDKSFTSSEEYADQNIQVLKNALEEVGVLNPPRYIPLHEIEAELAQLTALVNAGEYFDEKRLDYLLKCMEINPDYRVQQEAKNRIEREEMAVIVHEALETMRSIVPPNIAQLSIDHLKEDYGMSAALAKRLMTRKCLWLIHMSESDIMKFHEADLTGRYGYGAQNLDIVEKMAVYASMPSSFLGDGRGVKKRYVADLEQSVKQMLRQQKGNSLPKSHQRNLAYKDTKPYSDFMVAESAHSTAEVGNPIHRNPDNDPDATSKQ
jgi:hypothetical protein